MERNEIIEKYPRLCEEIQAEGYMRGFSAGVREGRALCRDLHKDKQVTQEKPALMCCLDDFEGACLILDEAARCPAMDVYNRFVVWFRETVGQNLAVPNVTIFGRAMGLRFKRIKSSGCKKYLGFRLRGVEPGASNADVCDRGDGKEGSRGTLVLK
jgi:hypothetical protein